MYKRFISTLTGIFFLLIIPVVIAQTGLIGIGCEGGAPPAEEEKRPLPQIVACEADEDCEVAGQICRDGLCITPAPEVISCAIHTDCPWGHFCKDGLCTMGSSLCRTREECKADEACINSVCLPSGGECASDSDCGSGFYCHDGDCVPSGLPVGCASNSDCPEGQVCVSGTCTIPGENHPPHLVNTIEDITKYIDETVTLDISDGYFLDDDGDPLIYGMKPLESIDTEPKFDNTTGIFTWGPLTSGDAGEHKFIFSASDLTPGGEIKSTAFLPVNIKVIGETKPVGDMVYGASIKFAMAPDGYGRWTGAWWDEETVPKDGKYQGRFYDLDQIGTTQVSGTIEHAEKGGTTASETIVTTSPAARIKLVLAQDTVYAAPTYAEGLNLNRNLIHAFAFVTNSEGQPINVLPEFSGENIDLQGLVSILETGVYHCPIYFDASEEGSTLQARIGEVSSEVKGVTAVAAPKPLTLEDESGGIVLPSKRYLAGQTFDVPVIINAGDKTLLSFGFRFKFEYPLQIDDLKEKGVSLGSATVGKGFEKFDPTIVASTQDAPGSVSFATAASNPISGADALQVAVIHFKVAPDFSGTNPVTPTVSEHCAPDTPDGISPCAIEYKSGSEIGSYAHIIPYVADYNGFTPGKTSGYVNIHPIRLKGIFAWTGSSGLFDFGVSGGDPVETNLKAKGVFNDSEFTLDDLDQSNLKLESDSDAVKIAYDQATEIYNIYSNESGDASLAASYVLDDTVSIDGLRLKVKKLSLEQIDARITDTSLDLIGSSGHHQTAQIFVYTDFGGETHPIDLSDKLDNITFEPTGGLSVSGSIVSATGDEGGTVTVKVGDQVVKTFENITVTNTRKEPRIHVTIPADIELLPPIPELTLPVDKYVLTARVTNLFSEYQQKVPLTIWAVFDGEAAPEGGPVWMDVTNNIKLDNLEIVDGDSVELVEIPVGDGSVLGVEARHSGGATVVATLNLDGGVEYSGQGPINVEMLAPVVEHSCKDIAATDGNAASILKALDFKNDIKVTAPDYDEVIRVTGIEVPVGADLISYEIDGESGKVIVTANGTGAGPVKLVMNVGDYAGIQPVECGFNVVTLNNIQMDLWEDFDAGELKANFGDDFPGGAVNLKDVVPAYTIQWIEGTSAFQQARLTMRAEWSNGDVQYLNDDELGELHATGNLLEDYTKEYIQFLGPFEKDDVTGWPAGWRFAPAGDAGDGKITLDVKHPLVLEDDQFTGADAKELPITVEKTRANIETLLIRGKGGSAIDNKPVTGISLEEEVKQFDATFGAPESGTAGLRVVATFDSGVRYDLVNPADDTQVVEGLLNLDTKEIRLPKIPSDPNDPNYADTPLPITGDLQKFTATLQANGAAYILVGIDADAGGNFVGDGYGKFPNKAVFRVVGNLTPGGLDVDIGDPDSADPKENRRTGRFIPVHGTDTIIRIPLYIATGGADKTLGGYVITLKYNKHYMRPAEPVEESFYESKYTPANVVPNIKDPDADPIVELVIVDTQIVGTGANIYLGALEMEIIEDGIGYTNLTGTFEAMIDGAKKIGIPIIAGSGYIDAAKIKDINSDGVFDVADPYAVKMLLQATGIYNSNGDYNLDDKITPADLSVGANILSYRFFFPDIQIVETDEGHAFVVDAVNRDGDPVNKNLTLDCEVVQTHPENEGLVKFGNDSNAITLDTADADVYKTGITAKYNDNVRFAVTFKNEGAAAPYDLKVTRDLYVPGTDGYIGCTSDDECGDLMICNIEEGKTTGECIPPTPDQCASDQDCPIGWECNTVTHECVKKVDPCDDVTCEKPNEKCVVDPVTGGGVCEKKTCATDGDCGWPDILFCSDVTGHCEYENGKCWLSGDCPLDEMCSDAHECIDPCSVPDVCDPNTQICQPDGNHSYTCLPKCEFNNDCDAGKICVSGACVDPGTCSSDEECNGGECIAGQCVGGGVCDDTHPCQSKFACYEETCLSDQDEDGVPDKVDNCKNTYNPDQADSDDDGIGDACDTGISCASDDDCDLSQVCQKTEEEGVCVTGPDKDVDGVTNTKDNCPDNANPGQEDCNANGIGDACDPEPCELPGEPVWGAELDLITTKVAAADSVDQVGQPKGGIVDNGDGNYRSAIVGLVPAGKGKAELKIANGTKSEPKEYGVTQTPAQARGGLSLDTVYENMPVTRLYLQLLNGKGQPVGAGINVNVRTPGADQIAGTNKTDKNGLIWKDVQVDEAHFAAGGSVQASVLEPVGLAGNMPLTITAQKAPTKQACENVCVWLELPFGAVHTTQPFDAYLYIYPKDKTIDTISVNLTFPKNLVSITTGDITSSYTSMGKDIVGNTISINVSSMNTSGEKELAKLHFTPLKAGAAGFSGGIDYIYAQGNEKVEDFSFGVRDSSPDYHAPPGSVTIVEPALKQIFAWAKKPVVYDFGSPAPAGVKAFGLKTDGSVDKSLIVVVTGGPDTYTVKHSDCDGCDLTFDVVRHDVQSAALIIDDISLNWITNLPTPRYQYTPYRVEATYDDGIVMDVTDKVTLTTGQAGAADLSTPGLIKGLSEGHAQISVVAPEGVPQIDPVTVEVKSETAGIEMSELHLVVPAYVEITSLNDLANNTTKGVDATVTTGFKGIGEGYATTMRILGVFSVILKDVTEAPQDLTGELQVINRDQLESKPGFTGIVITDETGGIVDIAGPKVTPKTPGKGNLKAELYNDGTPVIADPATEIEIAPNGGEIIVKRIVGGKEVLVADNIKLALTDDDITTVLKGYKASERFKVYVQFEGSPEEDVTSTASYNEGTAPLRYTLEKGIDELILTSNGTASGSDELTILAMGVPRSVTVDVVTLDKFEATLNAPYPESKSAPLKSDLYKLQGYTGDDAYPPYQWVKLWASAILTDGSDPIDLMKHKDKKDIHIDLSGNLKWQPEGRWFIRGTSAGNGSVTIGWTGHDDKTKVLPVTVQGAQDTVSALAIDSMEFTAGGGLEPTTDKTLTAVKDTEHKFKVIATYANDNTQALLIRDDDGTIEAPAIGSASAFLDVTAQDKNTLSKEKYNIYEHLGIDAYAVLNQDAGKMFLTAQANGAVAITAKVDASYGGSTPAKLDLAINLKPDLGDFDMGETLGVAYPDRPNNTASFGVPIRVNLGDKTLSNLQIFIFFNKDIIGLAGSKDESILIGSGLGGKSYSFTPGGNPQEGSVSVMVTSSPGGANLITGGTIEVANILFKPVDNNKAKVTLITGDILSLYDSTGQAIGGDNFSRPMVAGVGDLDPPDGIRGDLSGNNLFASEDIQKIQDDAAKHLGTIPNDITPTYFYDANDYPDAVLNAHDATVGSKIGVCQALFTDFDYEYPVVKDDTNNVRLKATLSEPHTCKVGMGEDCTVEADCEKYNLACKEAKCAAAEKVPSIPVLKENASVTFKVSGVGAGDYSGEYVDNGLFEALVPVGDDSGTMEVILVVSGPEGNPWTETYLGNQPISTIGVNIIGGPCDVPKDCGDGMLCVEGKCTEPGDDIQSCKDAPCPEGKVCVNKLCVDPGIFCDDGDNDDCGAKICVENKCVECASDAHCGTFEQCVNNVCELQPDHCLGDEHCTEATNPYCNTVTGKCVGCTDDTHCSTVTVCINNLCADPCTLNPCADPTPICVVVNHMAECKSEAEVECTEHENCDPDKICEGGKCKLGPDKDGDGITDVKDMCPNNPDPECKIEGEGVKYARLRFDSGLGISSGIVYEAELEAGQYATDIFGFSAAAQGKVNVFEKLNESLKVTSPIKVLRTPATIDLAVARGVVYERPDCDSDDPDLFNVPNDEQSTRAVAFVRDAAGLPVGGYEVSFESTDGNAAFAAKEGGKYVGVGSIKATTNKYGLAEAVVRVKNSVDGSEVEKAQIRAVVKGKDDQGNEKDIEAGKEIAITHDSDASCSKDSNACVWARLPIGPIYKDTEFIMPIYVTTKAEGVDNVQLSLIYDASKVKYLGGSSPTGNASFDVADVNIAVTQMNTAIPQNASKYLLGYIRFKAIADAEGESIITGKVDVMSHYVSDVAADSTVWFVSLGGQPTGEQGQMTIKENELTQIYPVSTAMDEQVTNVFYPELKGGSESAKGYVKGQLLYKNSELKGIDDNAPLDIVVESGDMAAVGTYFEFAATDQAVEGILKVTAKAGQCDGCLEGGYLLNLTGHGIKGIGLAVDDQELKPTSIPGIPYQRAEVTVTAAFTDGNSIDITDKINSKLVECDNDTGLSGQVINIAGEDRLFIVAADSSKTGGDCWFQSGETVSNIVNISIAGGEPEGIKELHAVIPARIDMDNVVVGSEETAKEVTARVTNVAESTTPIKMRAVVEFNDGTFEEVTGNSNLEFSTTYTNISIKDNELTPLVGDYAEVTAELIDAHDNPIETSDLTPVHIDLGKAGIVFWDMYKGEKVAGAIKIADPKDVAALIYQGVVPSYALKAFVCYPDSANPFEDANCMDITNDPSIKCGIGGDDYVEQCSKSGEENVFKFVKADIFPHGSCIAISYNEKKDEFGTSTFIADYQGIKSQLTVEVVGMTALKLVPRVPLNKENKESVDNPEIATLCELGNTGTFQIARIWPQALFSDKTKIDLAELLDENGNIKNNINADLPLKFEFISGSAHLADSPISTFHDAYLIPDGSGWVNIEATLLNKSDGDNKYKGVSKILVSDDPGNQVDLEEYELLGDHIKSYSDNPEDPYDNHINYTLDSSYGDSTYINVIGNTSVCPDAGADYYRLPLIYNGKEVIDAVDIAEQVLTKAEMNVPNPNCWDSVENENCPYNDYALDNTGYATIESNGAATAYYNGLIKFPIKAYNPNVTGPDKVYGIYVNLDPKVWDFDIGSEDGWVVAPVIAGDKEIKIPVRVRLAEDNATEPVYLDSFEVDFNFDKDVAKYVKTDFSLGDNYSCSGNEISETETKTANVVLSCFAIDKTALNLLASTTPNVSGLVQVATLTLLTVKDKHVTEFKGYIQSLTDAKGVLDFPKDGLPMFAARVEFDPDCGALGDVDGNVKFGPEDILKLRDASVEKILHPDELIDWPCNMTDSDVDKMFYHDGKINLKDAVFAQAIRVKKAFFTEFIEKPDKAKDGKAVVKVRLLDRDVKVATPATAQVSAEIAAETNPGYFAAGDKNYTKQDPKVIFGPKGDGIFGVNISKLNNPGKLTLSLRVVAKGPAGDFDTPYPDIVIDILGAACTVNGDCKEEKQTCVAGHCMDSGTLCDVGDQEDCTKGLGLTEEQEQGIQCIEGQCIKVDELDKECKEASGCTAKGLWCNPAGTCQLGCDEADDCYAPKVCNLTVHKCQEEGKECDNSGDCAPGQLCLEVEGAKKCVTDETFVGCEANADCCKDVPLEECDQTCINGVCTAKPVINGYCEEDDDCVSGLCDDKAKVCIEKCESNDDCGDSEKCSVHGECTDLGCQEMGKAACNHACYDPCPGDKTFDDACTCACPLGKPLEKEGNVCEACAYGSIYDEAENDCAYLNCPLEETTNIPSGPVDVLYEPDTPINKELAGLRDKIESTFFELNEQKEKCDQIKADCATGGGGTKGGGKLGFKPPIDATKNIICKEKLAECNKVFNEMNIYFVSEDGSDDEFGGFINKPFKTIGYAVKAIAEKQKPKVDTSDEDWAKAYEEYGLQQYILVMQGNFSESNLNLPMKTKIYGGFDVEEYFRKGNVYKKFELGEGEAVVGEQAEGGQVGGERRKIAYRCLKRKIKVKGSGVGREVKYTTAVQASCSNAPVTPVFDISSDNTVGLVGESSVLDGFKIAHTDDFKGFMCKTISIDSAEPVISNNQIIGIAPSSTGAGLSHTYAYAMPISLTNCSPKIINNIIIGNDGVPKDRVKVAYGISVMTTPVVDEGKVYINNNLIRTGDALEKAKGIDHLNVDLSSWGLNITDNVIKVGSANEEAAGLYMKGLYLTAYASNPDYDAGVLGAEIQEKCVHSLNQAQMLGDGIGQCVRPWEKHGLDPCVYYSLPEVLKILFAEFSEEEKDALKWRLSLDIDLEGAHEKTGCYLKPSWLTVFDEKFKDNYQKKLQKPFDEEKFWSIMKQYEVPFDEYELNKDNMASCNLCNIYDPTDYDFVDPFKMYNYAPCIEKDCEKFANRLHQVSHNPIVIDRNTISFAGSGTWFAGVYWDDDGVPVPNNNIVSDNLITAKGTGKCMGVEFVKGEVDIFNNTIDMSCNKDSGYTENYPIKLDFTHPRKEYKNPQSFDEYKNWEKGDSETVDLAVIPPIFNNIMISNNCFIQVPDKDHVLGEYNIHHNSYLRRSETEGDNCILGKLSPQPEDNYVNSLFDVKDKFFKSYDTDLRLTQISDPLETGCSMPNEYICRESCLEPMGINCSPSPDRECIAPLGEYIYDLDGKQRPIVKEYDRGAYEYGSTNQVLEKAPGELEPPPEKAPDIPAGGPIEEGEELPTKEGPALEIDEGRPPAEEEGIRRVPAGEGRPPSEEEFRRMPGEKVPTREMPARELPGRELKEQPLPGRSVPPGRGTQQEGRQEGGYR